MIEWSTVAKQYYEKYNSNQQYLMNLYKRLSKDIADIYPEIRIWFNE